MALIERGIYWGKFNGVESEPVGKADSVLRRAKGPRRVAQEYQATAVSSFTKPVYCICKGVYQSLALHLTTCMGLFFVD